MKLLRICLLLLLFFCTLSARTPLIQAIIDENVNAVLKNLHTKTMVNVRDTKYGFTPLTLAILQDNQEIIKLLINGGANLKFYESIEAYKLVSDHKLVTEDTDTRRKFPLAFIAAMTGNKKAIELIYAKNKALVFQKDYDGNSILSWAAFQGDLEIIKLLLSYGLDPLQKNFNGKNAIHFASMNKHHKVIKLFVVDMIKMGTNKSNLTKVFFEEIDNKDYHLLEFLLNHGINVNARFNSFTPFLKASKNGDVLMIEFLIKHGSKPYELVQNSNMNRRYYNYDALSLAILNGRNETVKYLLKNLHFDVNKRLHGGNYLHFIASNNIDLEYDTLELLIEKMKYNVNEKNMKGDTLLHTAVLNGNWEYINFLGTLPDIKVNISNKKGITPLRLAESRFLRFEKRYANDESDENLRELKLSEKVLEALYLVTLAKE